MASLRFLGRSCIRQKIILSLLTGKTIVIENIEPQLNEEEFFLLELVKQVTSGTVLNVSKQQDKFDLKPGSLIGGQFEYDCGHARGLSYFLELLVSVGPFCKQPLNVKLIGITEDQYDPSIDEFAYVALPILRMFIGETEQKIDIKTLKRGFKPDGRGEVIFSCPIVRSLKPVVMTDAGLIKKVRGQAVGVKVSPRIANRMIEKVKGILLPYLNDVYIYSDHVSGKSHSSPGFSLPLKAETTTGCIYSSSDTSNPKGHDTPSTPEDIAENSAIFLLKEIQHGACTDSKVQSLAFTFMAFNTKDASKIKIGPLTGYAKFFLRNLKDFCGVTFALDSKNFPQITATCIGIGYTNLNRPTY